MVVADRVDHRQTLTIKQAAVAARELKDAGQTLVMCHGCFDIVHPGHVRHLRYAATLGDRLLVTITGDAAMRKGEGRPLIPQEYRAESLTALECVDFVAIDPNPTAETSLETIRPDVYVKGREYEHNRDPRFLAERATVEGYGGRVVLSSGEVVFSSSALIDAIEETTNPFHVSLRKVLRNHDLTLDDADERVERFQGQRVLVIGETIIDTYVVCDRPSISGESPVMTLRPIENRSFDGGAAMAARHVAAMGGWPTLLTVLPANSQGEQIRQRLAVDGVQTRSIDLDQRLIEKQRFLVGTSKVMKLDLGGPLTLDASHQQQLAEAAIEAAEQCDAVILADFGHGLFTRALLERLCRELRPRVSLMVGDVSGQRSSLLSMHDMDLICPSEIEIREALHEFDEGLSAVAWRVLDRTNSRASIVTLGDGGLIAFDRRDDTRPSDWRSRLAAEHVPSFAPHAVDQLGCGDALLAAATLSLLTGSGLVMASILGSVAAAIEAQKLGNCPIAAADLRRGIGRLRRAQLAYHTESTAQVVTHEPTDPRDQLSPAHPRPTATT